MHALEKVQLASCRVVIDMTRCSGGVSHESTKLYENRNGEATEVKSEVTRFVDHEKAVARIDGARRKVVSVIKKHCKHTPVGYICPEARVSKLEDDLQDAMGACHDANLYAEAEGSARRVKPGITYAQVDWDDPGVQAAVFDTLADRVQLCADNARALPILRLAEVKQELLQIASVVSGPARHTLEMGAREIAAISEDRRRGTEPDYSVLDACVGWFRV